jgi:hypothetical protein
MAKQKKKRNKAYRGTDSKLNGPKVIKVEAANRNKASQWWFERKKIVRPIAIAVAVVSIVVWLLYELVRIIFFG